MYGSCQVKRRTPIIAEDHRKRVKYLAEVLIVLKPTDIPHAQSWLSHVRFSRNVRKRHGHRITNSGIVSIDKAWKLPNKVLPAELGWEQHQIAWPCQRTRESLLQQIPRPRTRSYVANDAESPAVGFAQVVVQVRIWPNIANKNVALLQTTN